MIEGGDDVGEAPSLGWQEEESIEIDSCNSPGMLLVEKQWGLVGNSYTFGKREFPQLEDMKQ